MKQVQDDPLISNLLYRSVWELLEKFRETHWLNLLSSRTSSFALPVLAKLVSLYMNQDFSAESSQNPTVYM